ncbi:aldo/keto reductase [Paenibacillus campi]|uniref:aldo/keto reductase n=1 Tax=Paenibacillus campi TaxID=3106031 RepID=UPI002AFF33FD|nr:aldo/keto reductase [Paenibacillus sp. SGZ-1014]
MKYRYLGRSGLQVSLLGLGTNSFGKRADQKTSIEILHAAIDSGVNFIDTANIYANTASEEIIGVGLKGAKRHEVILATKAGLPRGEGANQRGSSRYHLQRELENSLRRLQTDHIDLYQIHTFDPNTPLEETLRTLEHMVQSGKVRYIGASNYAAWELMKALGLSDWLGLERFISIQTSYSLADRTPEQELIPLCLDQGIGIIPYFPLAGGILTGKYSQEDEAPAGSRADKDPSFNRLMTGERIGLADGISWAARSLEIDPAVLSLAWLMEQPAVSSIIAGATCVTQLNNNLHSIDVVLSDKIKAELEHLSKPFRYSEPFATYRLW